MATNGNYIHEFSPFEKLIQRKENLLILNLEDVVKLKPGIFKVITRSTEIYLEHN